MARRDQTSSRTTTRHQQSRRTTTQVGKLSWVWPACVGLAALGLYLTLVPPVSGDKDGSEMTLVLALGAASHPTGYPIFTLLGHAFTLALHGLGMTWSWAANAWSALGGAVAVALLFQVVVELVPLAVVGTPGRQRMLALAPTTLFALNPIWTYETVLAEVYSWHVAWSVGACLLMLRIVRRLGDESIEWTARTKTTTVALWGAMVGLGAAHHATSVLVAAPLSIALLVVARRQRLLGWREVGITFAAALVPLASYGFVAWRAFHPALWGWPTLEPSWASVWAHVTGAGYRHYLGRFAPSAEQAVFLSRYVYPFLVPALAILLVTSLLGRRSDQATSLRAMTGAAMLTTVYGFSYGVPDPSSYFVAPMAIGLAGLLPALSCIARGTARPKLVVATAVLLALTVVALAPSWIEAGRARRRVMLAFDQRVRAMWASIPFEEGIVIYASDMHLRLVEYQTLERSKPAIDVVNPTLLRAEGPRTSFAARYGLDPVTARLTTPPAGAVSIESLSWADRVVFAVNERLPQPVVVFDPENETVRLLRKPAPTPEP